MRTHIFSVLLLLMTMVACASKEHLTAAQEQKLEERQEMQTDTQYSQFDGPAAGREGPASERQ